MRYPNVSTPLPKCRVTTRAPRQLQEARLIALIRRLPEPLLERLIALCESLVAADGR